MGKHLIGQHFPPVGQFVNLSAAEGHYLSGQWSSGAWPLNSGKDPARFRGNGPGMGWGFLWPLDNGSVWKCRTGQLQFMAIMREGVCGGNNKRTSMVKEVKLMRLWRLFWCMGNILVYDNKYRCIPIYTSFYSMLSISHHYFQEIWKIRHFAD